MRTVALVAVLAAASTAQAGTSTAERLFDEGLALVKKGDFASACTKFEESLARDPRQLGAMLQLGNCNQQQGNVATALKYYRAAREQAIEAGKDRSRQQAENQIQLLEPELPRLRFVRDRDAYPGEKLVFDDSVTLLTEQLTPDPGEHSVTLTAPGRLPYETKITLEKRQRLEIELPALAVPENSVTTREKSSRRAVGKTLAIAGVGTAIVTGGLALLAKRDYDALFEGDEPHCGLYADINGSTACDDYGVSISDRDRKLVTIGVIGATVGLAVAVTGILLWTTAPAETSSTTIVPSVGADGTTVLLQRTVSW